MTNIIKTIKNNICGRSGLFGTCYKLILNSDKLRKQTKKAINNKFIQDAMTEFLRQQLEVYFIENKTDAEKIANQVLVNKKSRENAERQELI